MNIDKFTIASYDQITGFDRTNGSLDLILDELTDFNLSNSEDKSEITGKGGRVIGTLKKNYRQRHQRFSLRRRSCGTDRSGNRRRKISNKIYRSHYRFRK